MWLAEAIPHHVNKFLAVIVEEIAITKNLIAQTPKESFTLDKEHIERIK